MGLVCHANAQRAAAGRGVTIKGNQVLMVFRNDFAVRLLAADPAAGFEAPIRIYVYENADGTATVSYLPPSVALALSFAKTSAAGQVVDLSALILTHSQLDDHSRAPPASAAPVPLRRPPPARDREPRPASATRRIQEDGAPAPASHDGPPLLGRTGQSLDRHLRRTLTRYFAYYHEARTHLSLDKDAPDGRSVERPERGRVISIREVGGLHHRYVRRAA